MQENPLTRTRNLLRLTQEQVAIDAGITRLAVIRNEQGCYPKPSPTLMEFFCLDSSAILEYKEFQSETRRSNYGLLTPSWLINHLYDTPTHNPISMWRTYSDMSKQAISTAFCMHPDIISRLELRPHLVPNRFPVQFIDALVDAGYQESQLLELSEVYQNWRKSQRSKAA